jgi:cobalt/nickel transport protein
VVLAVFSFLASSFPDGLERVAEDKGFLKKATVSLRSPIADYAFPGIKNKKLAGSIAGITGVLVMFWLGLSLAKLLRDR